MSFLVANLPPVKCFVRWAVERYWEIDGRTLIEDNRRAD